MIVAHAPKNLTNPCEKWYYDIRILCGESKRQKMPKLKDKINSFQKAHPGFCEVVRFLIVGGIATLIDMFVMGLVLYAFEPSLYPKFYNIWFGGGEPRTVATVVGTASGFLSGLIVNYIFSVLFVFNNKGKSKSVGGFIVFALLSAVGLGIHVGGMYLGYNVLGINEWIVKIALTLIVLVYNYISKRMLLFRKSAGGGTHSVVAAEVPSLGLLTAERELNEERGKRMKISIVVPCYNEEACVEKYYEAMELVRKKLPTEFEYIFVDDGSKDNTLNILRKLSSCDDAVRYVSFSRNFGKEAAILAGLKAAKGDYVGLMDADLQDPPEMLLEMYSGLVNEGYDCVSCRRTDRKGESKIRSAFARMFYKLINRMSDADIMDGARDYRLMTRRMTDSVLSMSERERFSKGIFGWVGFKTKWLEYKNTERVAGNTKWSFKKLTKYAIGGIEDFSTAPLKFNFIFSMLSFIVALTFAVLDIVWACIGHGVSALFIALPVMCFIASLLLFGMGLLGEYIKKIFYEVKARPVYIVRETDDDLSGAGISAELLCAEENEATSENGTQAKKTDTTESGGEK